MVSKKRKFGLKKGKSSKLALKKKIEYKTLIKERKKDFKIERSNPLKENIEKGQRKG